MTISNIVRDLKEKYIENKIYDIDTFILNLAKRIHSGETINYDDLFIFEKRIEALQNRLGFTLPEDYISFLREYAGAFSGDGYWFQIENIQLASNFDIENYIIVEDFPERLSSSDLTSMIPIYIENDSYVLMDLKPNNKGVFVIWSDEEELYFQSSDFNSFQTTTRAYAKQVLNSNRKLIECDFFNFSR